DFDLWPLNDWPKIEVRVTRYGNFAFPRETEAYVSIAGVWGYGDGTSDPWEVTVVTGTVATAGGKTLTLSAEDTVQAGNTIRMGTEDCYVSEVTTDDSKEATIEREVNGTTAAAHTTAAISIAQYPSQIGAATIEFATRFFKQLGGEVFESEGLGDYRYKRFSSANQRDRDMRLISGFRRYL
ncbi:hypothetical protein LCGC14_2019880, partial [marine sediment metagenome]